MMTRNMIKFIVISSILHIILAQECFPTPDNISCTCIDKSIACIGIQKEPSEIEYIFSNISLITLAQNVDSLTLNIQNLTIPLHVNFKDIKVENLTISPDFPPLNEDFFSGVKTILIYLNLHGNALTSVPSNLKELEKLEHLILSNNYIEKLQKDDFIGLQDLQILDLSNNNIEEIENGTFSLLANLIELYLDFNNLTSLDSHMFINLDNLQHLSLSQNNIYKLNPFLLEYLPSIKVLIVDDNDFSSLSNLDVKSSTLKKLFARNCSIQGNLEESALQSLSELEYLDLSCNQIAVVESTALSSLKKLKYLDLSNNTIYYLKDNSFASLYNLLDLDLKFNKIKRMEIKAFFNLTNLVTLDLSNNEIYSIICKYTSDLFNLQKINLKGNNLMNIEPGTFHYSPDLNEIQLPENTLDCSCSLSYFASLLGNISSAQNQTYLDTVICGSPKLDQGKPLSEINFQDMNCPLIFPCESEAKIQMELENEDNNYDDYYYYDNPLDNNTIGNFSTPKILNFTSLPTNSNLTMENIPYLNSTDEESYSFINTTFESSTIEQTTPLLITSDNSSPDAIALNTSMKTNISSEISSEENNVSSSDSTLETTLLSTTSSIQSTLNVSSSDIINWNTTVETTSSETLPTQSSINNNSSFNVDSLNITLLNETTPTQPSFINDSFSDVINLNTTLETTISNITTSTQSFSDVISLNTTLETTPNETTPTTQLSFMTVSFSDVISLNTTLETTISNITTSTLSSIINNSSSGGMSLNSTLETTNETMTTPFSIMNITYSDVMSLNITMETTSNETLFTGYISPSDSSAPDSIFTVTSSETSFDFFPNDTLTSTSTNLNTTKTSFFDSTLSFLNNSDSIIFEMTTNLTSNYETFNSTIESIASSIASDISVLNTTYEIFDKLTPYSSISIETASENISPKFELIYYNFTLTNNILCIDYSVNLSIPLESCTKYYESEYLSFSKAITCPNVTNENINDCTNITYDFLLLCIEILDGYNEEMFCVDASDIYLNETTLDSATITPFVTFPTKDDQNPFNIISFNLMIEEANVVLANWDTNKNESLNFCHMALTITSEEKNQTDYFNCTSHSVLITEINTFKTFNACLTSYHVVQGNMQKCKPFVYYDISHSSASKDQFHFQSFPFIVLLCLLAIVILLVVVIILKILYRKNMVSKQYNVVAAEEGVQRRISKSSENDHSLRFSYTANNDSYI